ncbi:hypothetical protein [Thiothrix winogradskyi]|uniref:Uncharacterized protein n=1 Tax=Thiothrix winogradskyi TaxID=96472 RepID=A0ABY3T432_9GAMM|nr:hypothetical protein [Thiothrix winogradskyi]UJS26326.1 hypothetical protein L2Y54_09880 [Thiothrix winogradskyi]
MNLTKSCLMAVLAFTLSACGDETSVTHVAAVAPAPAATSNALTQSSVPAKPAGVVEEFFTSSMPDTFTIPHNTCAQGEALQTLKKE